MLSKVKLCLIAVTTIEILQLVIFALSQWCSSNSGIPGVQQFSFSKQPNSGTMRNLHRAFSSCSVDPSAGTIQVFEGSKMIISDVEKRVCGVKMGGSWQPRDCLARSRVALLVPYRNRQRELVLFFNHMHPFLQRQKLEYTIFIVEQSANHWFNKGAVVNAGFREVVSRNSYDCFIINDVDVLPEDDRIRYECADHPRHLAAAVNIWKYGLMYDYLFGGAIAFTRHQYTKVNGFSNAYFGWGGEDDDLSARVTDHGYKILRNSPTISHFKALQHKRPEHNTHRFYYYHRRKQRYMKDGLNSIQYNLISYEEKPLYTHIIIGLDYASIMDHVHSLMVTRRESHSSAPMITKMKTRV